MKDYTLLNPVFQINGALNCGERSDLCVIPYVRISDNIHPKVAVEQLRAELSVRYNVPLERVIFHFFADSWVGGSGAPQVIE